MSDTAIAQNTKDDPQRQTTDPKADTNDTPNNDIKDNGNAKANDESPAPKKLKLTNDVNNSIANEKSTPTARTKSSKRLNILEKTAKEGEALLQNLGHKAEEDDSNRRRTRSQTRGTPAPSVVAPPKKAATPKTPTKEPSSSGPKRRGRPPKNVNNSVESKTESKSNDEEVNAEKSETSDTETTEKTNEKTVNNSTESNDANAKPQTTPSEETPKESTEEKPTATTAAESAATEQSKDVSAKSNSISEDTSKSVPVLDTQQPTTE